MKAPKIRILYVIENECFGGGERAFAQLINGLDKTRFEVYAACLTSRLNPASTAFAGKISGAARILELDLRRLINPSAFFSLKRMIRENNIRIVHSQGARADFYARLAARAAGGAAVVSTIAAPVYEYNVNFLRKFAYRVLDRFGRSAADRFIAVADHIAGKLVPGGGVSKKKITRIYNGVDAAEFLCRPDLGVKARAAYNIPADCFLAGAFCRLSWEKGLGHLVEAAKIISGNGAAVPGGIKFLIAGAGPLESKLKAGVERLGVKDIFIFTGFVEDVRPLLSAIDVFVLPSFREGFPMSVLEAMTMGKPVIASNIAGVDESVADGSSGLLVPSGDSAALAGAIETLFKDRARAAGMGWYGRKTAVEKFGLDKMIKAHEELYEEFAAVPATAA